MFWIGLMLWIELMFLDWINALDLINVVDWINASVLLHCIYLTASTNAFLVWHTGLRDWKGRSDGET
jgi:hypothetical protein